MKEIGLVFNTKKMLRYFILLIIGLTLMFYSAISYYEQQRLFEQRLTDEEVIIRAKALGLVEITEQLKEKTND
ncbi:MAG: hypothetical protein LCH34_11110 [Firmicutes bacterium]|nr:hypothetical protein [Bacillota bacterium]